MSDLYRQAILNKASKDKFLMIFDVPIALRHWDTKFRANSKTVNRDSIQFSIFGTVVPEVSVPSLVLPYAGQSMKVSSHAREPYEDVTLGFTVDNRFQNWWTIWKWLDLLNNAKQSGYDMEDLGSETINYLRNYQTDFTVLACDEFDDVIMEFRYTHAFPTHLQRIEYDYKNPEQIVSGFTFSYSQFHAKPITF